MSRIGLSLFLLLLHLPAWALNPALIESADARLVLGEYTGYLEDPKGELSYQQVSDLPDSAFSEVSEPSVNLGKSRSTWWFKVNFDSRLNAPLSSYLEVNYSLIDRFQVYLRSPDGSLQEFLAGDTLAYDQRPIKVRNFWFPLELAEGRSTLLLRVQTSSTLYLPMVFSSLQASAEAQEFLASLNGAYYGVLFAMFFYNLFLFFSLRERVYFWYLLYSLSIIVMAFSIDGWLFNLYPDNITLQSSSIYILMILSSLLSVQFSRHFLHTPDLFPKLDRGMRWAIAFNAIFLSAGLVLEVQTWGALASLCMLSTASLLMLSGLHVWRSGLRYGSYYVIAWSSVLISIVLTTLSSLGIEPISAHNPDLIKVGVAIELILISIGLADRINVLKEEGFRARQVATQATIESHAKSRFLAKMSHEIRTPLNGVLGMLQLLRETKLERNQRFYLNTVLSSGDALLGVINNLIDFARIESGHIKLEQIDFDLEDLLSDSLHLFTVQAMKKHLRLYLTLDKNVPRWIQGDPTRLRQVLINLLGNALKFTNSGHISLHVSLQFNNKQTEQLLFSVQDSGIGIDSQAIGQLFKSFAQADVSTTRRFGGSGLGLAISKELVEMMGGQIQVSSNLGQGSNFNFCLPFLPTTSNNSNHFPMLEGRKVLTASLDGRGLDALELLLARWNMQCTRCHDTERFVKQLRESPADTLLIIMSPWPGSATQWLESLRPHLQQGQAVIFLGPPEQLQELPSIDGLALLDLPLPLTVSALRGALEDIYLETDNSDIRNESNAVPNSPLILVAEDNQVNQMVIGGLLKNAGYSYKVVANGLEAVAAFQQNPEAIQLILMDCEMPQMDGFAATHAIRQLEQEQQRTPIPIIALTAHQIDDQRQHGQQVGLSDYLGKPIESALLYRTLERYLGKPDSKKPSLDTSTSGHS